MAIMNMKAIFKSTISHMILDTKPLKVYFPPEILLTFSSYMLYSEPKQKVRGVWI